MYHVHVVHLYYCMIDFVSKTHLEIESRISVHRDSVEAKLNNNSEGALPDTNLLTCSSW